MLKHAITAALGVVTAFVADLAQSEATASVISTFDTDLDGWTGDNPGEVSFSATGGNPGGFLKFTDGAPAGGLLIAPSKFLGDWTGMDGTGHISYDYRTINSGSHIEALAREVRIEGPGGAANFVGSLPCPGNFCTSDFESIFVPLTEASWNVTSGSWSALLANVTDFQVRGDHYTTLSSGDSEGFDNIFLSGTPGKLAVIPLPSALTVLASGLVGLGVVARPRKRGLRFEGK